MSNGKIQAIQNRQSMRQMPASQLAVD